MGGLSGTSTFYTLDMDANKNIAVGGETQDSTVATLYNAIDPIVVYIQTGNLYKWGVSFAGKDYDRVGSIRFNPSGSKIAAIFQDSSQLLPLQIGVLQSVDGTVLKMLKDASGNVEIITKTGGSLLVDSADAIYIGYHQKVNSNKRWSLAKLVPFAATSPLTAPWYFIGYRRDPTLFQGPWSLIFNTAQTQVLAGGANIYNDNRDYYVSLISVDSTSGTKTWTYGFYESTNGQPYWKLGFITLYSSGGTEIVWGCGEKELSATTGDFFVMSVTLNGLTIPAAAGTTFASWLGPAIRCRGIGKTTATSAYMFASKIQDFRLMKADFSGPSKILIQYQFENSFASGTLNQMYHGIFPSGQTNHTGSINQIAGNLNKAFTKQVGFVMSLDPTLVGAQQTTNCLYLTVSYSTTITLDSTSKNWGALASNTFTSDGTKTITLDLVLVARKLLSMTLIDNLSWCPITNAVTFGPSPFVDIAYDIGSGGSTTSAASVFTFAVPPVCTDAVFAYSATLQTGAALPAFITYNALTNVFDWSTATSANIGVYPITVKGLINNDQVAQYTFSLTLRSCGTAVITPSSYNNVLYYITMPVTLTVLTFSPFISDMPVSQCGTLSYDIKFQGGAVLTNPPYIYPGVGTDTLTLGIQTTDSSLEFTGPHPIEVFGWQGTNIAGAVSFPLEIGYTTSCNLAVISPPTALSVIVQVNAPSAIVVLVSGFTSDLTGCETQIVYSCTSCTDPTLVVFYSVIPIRMEIKTTSNVHVGSHSFIVNGNIPGGGTSSWEIKATVQPDCTLTGITGGEPNELVKYDISSKKEVIISPPIFETQYLECAPNLAYRLIDLGLQNITADPLVFTLMMTGPYIKLNTVDPSKVRTYRLGLVAEIGTNNKTTVLTVQVLNQCPTISLLPVTYPEHVFDLGSSVPLLVLVTPWPDSLGGTTMCGPHIYHVSFSNTAPLDTTWITFDSTRIRVKTDDLSKVGIYEIRISGKVLQATKVTYSVFKVEIRDPCLKSIITPSMLVQGLEYKAGSGLRKVIYDPWKESFNGKCEPFKYSIETEADKYLKVSYLANIDEPTRTLSFKVNSGLYINSWFAIKLIGKLKNGVQASTILNITLLPDLDPPYAFLPKADNKTQPDNNLLAKVKSIDNKGNLRIQFSKPLALISNLTAIFTNKAISLELTSNIEGVIKPEVEAWRVEGQQQSFLFLAIKFSHPDKISQTTVTKTSSNFKYRLQILLKLFLMSLHFSKVLMVLLQQQKIEESLEKYLSKIILIAVSIQPVQKFLAFGESIESAAKESKQVLAGTIGMNFIICLIFGASMSNMWQLMNILQIITMLPLLKLPFASSFQTLCQALATLAQFDILPESLSFNSLRQALLGINSFDDLITFDNEPTQNTTSKKRFLQSQTNSDSVFNLADLAAIGIETNSIVTNLGSLGDLMIFLILFSIILQLLLVLKRINTMFGKIYDYFSKMLFFNTYIQTSTQSYLYFTIITLYSALNYDHLQTMTDKIVTSIMFVYLIMYPLLALFFIFSKGAQLADNEALQDRFGSFYDGLHLTHGRAPLFCIMFFLIRRGVLAGVLLIMSEHPLFQILLMIIFSMGILVYQAHFRPYVMRADRIFEFINESTLLVVSYLLLALHLHHLEHQERSAYLDYSIVFVILTVFLANFIHFIVSSVRDMRLTLLRTWHQLKLMARQFIKELFPGAFQGTVTIIETKCCECHRETVKMRPQEQIIQTEQSKLLIDEEQQEEKKREGLPHDDIKGQVKHKFYTGKDRVFGKISNSTKIIIQKNQQSSGMMIQRGLLIEDEYNNEFPNN